MKNIFKTDDYVVYGSNGICRITDIREENFAGEEKRYYVLSPSGNPDSVIFVPLDKEELTSKLRPVMSKEETDRILSSVSVKEMPWENDRKVRAVLFHDIISQGDQEALLLMLRCIYLHRKEILTKNKRLSGADSDSLQAAEKIVRDEFAHCLGMTVDDTVSYIKVHLGVEDAV